MPSGSTPPVPPPASPLASRAPADLSAPMILDEPNKTSDDLSSDKPVQPVEDINCDIDPELLEALGNPADDAPVYGQDIHATLAQRWLPILKKGLLTETKEKMMKALLIPDNCKLLRAPTLNPEISAAVSDQIRLRDKKIQNKQDQLGIGITAIGRAMSLLLTSEDKEQAIKLLSDGFRILTDLHFIETQVRTKLITPGLGKSILTMLHDESRDETLYGNALSDKIKASKAIERQGQQIKKTKTQKASSSAASNNSRPRQQGNWSAPPRYTSASRGGRMSNYRTSRQHQYRRAQQSLPPTTTLRSSTSAPTTANKRVPARQ